MSGAMVGDGNAAFPLRFAVACCDRVQAWQQRCITELFDGGRALWIAMVSTGSRSHPRVPTLFDPAAQRSARLELGPHEPLRIAQTDSARLAALDVDAVLSFDDLEHGTALASCARLGVWRFEFGGGPGRAAEPPCFWECFHGEAVVDVALVQRSRDGRDAVLQSGAFAVSPTSLGTSVDRALYEAALWPALAARNSLRAAGGRAAAASVAAAPRASAAFAIALALKMAGRRLARAFDVFFADKWNVGIARCAIDAFLRGNAWPRVDWLPEVDGLDYRADPFGATVDGKTWALVERYDAGAARGRIEALPVTRDAPESPKAPDAPHGVFAEAMVAQAHMSYPYMVEHRGQLYCMPETLGQHGVSLYRAVDLPARWERVAVLLDGFEAVDATVVRHDGRFWLFCTDFREPRHHRLYVFHADELTGPYAAHAANPVKIDPRSAGCAGTPFVVDGVLYRPAQDCSRSYGGRVVINRVVELTPTAFREEPAAVVPPTRRYPAGVHTLSAAGTITLVDGKRRQFTLRRLRWRLLRAFRRGRRARD